MNNEVQFIVILGTDQGERKGSHTSRLTDPIISKVSKSQNFTVRSAEPGKNLEHWIKSIKGA